MDYIYVETQDKQRPPTTSAHNKNAGDLNESKPFDCAREFLCLGIASRLNFFFN